MRLWKSEKMEGEKREISRFSRGFCARYTCCPVKFLTAEGPSGMGEQSGKPLQDLFQGSVSCLRKTRFSTNFLVTQGRRSLPLKQRAFGGQEYRLGASRRDWTSYRIVTKKWIYHCAKSSRPEKSRKIAQKCFLPRSSSRYGWPSTTHWKIFFEKKKKKLLILVDGLPPLHNEKEIWLKY